MTLYKTKDRTQETENNFILSTETVEQTLVLHTENNDVDVYFSLLLAQVYKLNSSFANLLHL